MLRNRLPRHNRRSAPPRASTKRFSWRVAHVLNRFSRAAAPVLGRATTRTPDALAQPVPPGAASGAHPTFQTRPPARQGYAESYRLFGACRRPCQHRAPKSSLEPIQELGSARVSDPAETANYKVSLLALGYALRTPRPPPSLAKSQPAPLTRPVMLFCADFRVASG
jgi:hypothetical protein